MGKRPGKYDHLLHRLPKALGTEPKAQERYDLLKAEIVEGTTRWHTECIETLTNVLIMMAKNEPRGRANPDAAQLAQDYELARNLENLMEVCRKSLSEWLVAYEQQYAKACELEGLQSVTLLSGKTVAVQPAIYASVSDQDALRAWAVKNKLENLLSIHPSRLLSMVKELLLAGKPAPEGVKASVRDQVVLR